MDALQLQAMAKAGQARSQLELQRISVALVRLQQGDFGECMECRETIAAARLEANPTVTLCIACASAREKQAPGYRRDSQVNSTPTLSDFNAAYETYRAPWIIGEPQPAVVELERNGWISGSVLDAGRGAGEHTILLARLGYDVLGIDASDPAIEYARANAKQHGVSARFAVSDALHLGSEQYDTVLDSALFHIFDDADRAWYVASLHAACRPGGLVHVLALSDEGPGFGPEVSDTILRDAFGAGWQLEELGRSHYLAVATADHHVTQLGFRQIGRAHV